MKTHQKHGFTLLELAVVIAIIGLIAGGIVAGKGLLRQAEVRSAKTRLTSYETAILAFKEKYNELPGDMTNAERFWGSMSTGSCPNATGSVGSETCNGDGDGRLEWATAANRAGEQFTAWQHLASSGLVVGNFTGRAGSLNPYHAIVGQNVPAGPFPQSGFSFMWYARAVNDSGVVYAGEYQNNFIFFGNTPDDEGDVMNNTILSASEAWTLDTKIDDGKPAYGSVVVHRPNFRPDCATSNTGSLAEYQLDNEEPQACTIIYLFNR